MKTAKLGVVLASTRPGGTELAVLRLLQHLDRSRFEPHVCVLAGQGPLAAEFRAASASFTALDARGALDLPRLLCLRDWIAATDPDLLHSYLYAPNFGARLWGQRGRRRPVVVSIRGIEQWRHRVLDDLERWVWPRATAVLANSAAAAAVMRGRFGEGVPIHVIRNGILPVGGPPRDQARAHLGYGGEPLILCVANFVWYKQHEALLLAFQRTRLELPRARLLLAGGGAREASLRALAVRLRVAGGVDFLGIRRDTAGLYAACNAVVLASTEESLPNVLLEAGSAARASVATDVGGVSEVVVDGVTGILVPPLESRPMATALIGLLEDPEAADALGRAARAHVHAEFTLEREVRETEAFYTRLLEGAA